MKLDKLAEANIRRAQREGKLDELAGEGKPLKASATDGSIEAFGYGAMASEGVVPEEVQLRKAVEQQQKVLAGLADGDAKKREMKKLADLQMRLSMQEEARRRYFSS